MGRWVRKWRDIAIHEGQRTYKRKTEKRTHDSYYRETIKKTKYANRSEDQAEMEEVPDKSRDADGARCETRWTR